jgi:hypothetical protein
MGLPYGPPKGACPLRHAGPAEVHLVVTQVSAPTDLWSAPAVPQSASMPASIGHLHRWNWAQGGLQPQCRPRKAVSSPDLWATTAGTCGPPLPMLGGDGERPAHVCRALSIKERTPICLDCLMNRSRDRNVTPPH